VNLRSESTLEYEGDNVSNECSRIDYSKNTG
jgi:hypothetical protein